MSTVALTPDMTAEQYHAYPAVSNSRISDFIEDPRLYYHKWLSGNYKPKAEKHFEIGSAAHEILLRNSHDRIAVIPEDVLAKNGAKSGNAWKQWSAENSGKIQLKSKDYAAVLRCCEVVRQHPAASQVLAYSGDCEYPMSAEFMGMHCKCCFDKLCRTSEGHLIVDFKTTEGGSTANKFVKSVASYGYYRQAAFYKTIAQLNGLEIYDFIFLVVSITEPYTVDLFRLDEEFIDMGMQEIDEAMIELIERTENNDWSGRGADQVVSLSPPSFLKYNRDYAL